MPPLVTHTLTLVINDDHHAERIIEIRKAFNKMPQASENKLENEHVWLPRGRANRLQQLAVGAELHVLLLLHTSS